MRKTLHVTAVLSPVDVVSKPCTICGCPTDGVESVSIVAEPDRCGCMYISSCMQHASEAIARVTNGWLPQYTHDLSLNMKVGNCQACLGTLVQVPGGAWVHTQKHLCPNVRPTPLGIPCTTK